MESDLKLRSKVEIYTWKSGSKLGLGFNFGFGFKKSKWTFKDGSGFFENPD